MFKRIRITRKSSHVYEVEADDQHLEEGVVAASINIDATDIPRVHLTLLAESIELLDERGKKIAEASITSPIFEGEEKE